MFPEYLPGKRYIPGTEYVSLGFLYEPGKDLPIGVSRRNTQGLDRVFLNCAICHTGSVRGTPHSPRTVYTGMPSNTVDLEAFERFILPSPPLRRCNVPGSSPGREGTGENHDRASRFSLPNSALLLSA